MFFPPPRVPVSNAASVRAAFKQVALVACFFHHSFNDIKCFIYFPDPGIKPAVALHLGTGDGCEEKRSDAAQSIFRNRETLSGGEEGKKKRNSSGTNDCKLFCLFKN